MPKKKKDKSLASQPPMPQDSDRSRLFYWFPSIVLLIVPAYVVFRSTAEHDYAHYAYWVQNDVLNALSVACFVTAAVTAVFAPFRQLLVQHLDRLSKATWKAQAFWILLAFSGLMAWFWFVRYCEYRAYLLPTDTSIEVEQAYVFLHHGTLEYPMWGTKVLSQHFILLFALFSPVLMIRESPLALLLLQNLFVCSIPIAAYGLVYLLTRSAFAGSISLLLVLAAPPLYELLTSNLDVVPLAAFFLAAMFFFYRKNWLLSGMFLVLMAACKEQVPFIYFGLGLYSIYALRKFKPWNWPIGAGLCILAIAVWYGEISMIRYYESFEPMFKLGTNKWEMFARLVPSQTLPDRILSEIVRHPLRSLRAEFSSIYVFYPLLRVLFSMGFLCLLAPMQMIPFFAAFLPHLLAATGAPVNFFDFHPITYNDLGLHHGAYMFGPLIWATVHGIRRAYDFLSARRMQSWLLVWALAFAGFGFKYAHRTLNPYWRPTWFDAMPRVAALIPKHARLWADEYALAPLSARRWLKAMQWGPENPIGFQSLFKPDYVLFDKAFVFQAQPPYRDRMLTFFARQGYKKIADDTNVILLKSPQPSSEPEADITEWMQLPEPDPETVRTYGKYLVSGPLSPA